MRLRTSVVQELRKLLGGKWKREWKVAALEGQKRAGAELHLGGGYFTVTFAPLPNAAECIDEVSPETLRWLVQEAGPAFAGTTSQPARQGAPVAKPEAPRGPGFLRIKPSSLEAIARHDEIETQLALAYAAGSGSQQRAICRSVTPPWLQKLPGRNPASTRAQRHIVAARKALVAEGRLRLMTEAERPKGRPGKAAAFDLPWLHAENDGGPSPRLRWPRLALRRLLLELRPAEMRLLALLVSRHGLAGAEPFDLSAHALAREWEAGEAQVSAAADGLVRAGLLLAETGPKHGKAGRYRLGPWNGEGVG
jgi:hypothetical protein